MILGPCLALGLAILFTLDAFTGYDAWGLWLVAVLISARATWELTQLLRIRSFVVQAWLVQISCLLVISANWLGHLWIDRGDSPTTGITELGPVMLVFALVLMALLWNQAYRFQRPGNSMESLGAEIFIVCYVSILLTFTVQLRWVAGLNTGYIALGSLVVAAKSGDIGAYFLGKFFGRRKMIERLSPGKTWMGAVGALVGAAGGSLVWFLLIAPLLQKEVYRPQPVWIIVYGVAIGIVGLLGDLCESLIKRDTGRKDSAELIPEFGGILDVVDSVIYSAPLAYLLWIVLPLS